MKKAGLHWAGLGLALLLLTTTLEPTMGGDSAAVAIIEEVPTGKPADQCQDIICPNSTTCQSINSMCLVCGFGGRCHSEGTICNTRCRGDGECGGSCPSCINSRCVPSAVQCSALNCETDAQCSSKSSVCTVCGLSGTCHNDTGICDQPCDSARDCGGHCQDCLHGYCRPGDLPAPAPAQPPSGRPVPAVVPVYTPTAPIEPPLPSGSCPPSGCTYDADCSGQGDCMFCLASKCYSNTSVCQQYCSDDSQCAGVCPSCQASACRPRTQPNPYNHPIPFSPSPYSPVPPATSCPRGSLFCTIDADCSGIEGCEFCISSACWSRTTICGLSCRYNSDCAGDCPVCSSSNFCIPRGPSVANEGWKLRDDDIPFPP